MDWNCERCGFELVEIQKSSMIEVIEKYNFLGIPEDWPIMDFDWIKLCPSCNSDPLGIDQKQGLPIRTNNGDITTIHELDFIKAHKHTEFRTEILKSDICGCFHCLETFKPDEIDEWHGEPCDEYELLAFCPKCGIDSVIGSKSGFPIEQFFLKKMQDFWFSPSTFSKTIKNL